MSKEYCAEHIEIARERLVKMMEALDSGGVVVSLKSSSEKACGIGDPKTETLFVCMEIVDSDEEDQV